MTVRTRFAPSPTGYLHIGGVRTALFNWLFAKQHGGEFILRIDDTDADRNVESALQPILDGFRWLGILWDEGPEVGGKCGPYFQSQRLSFYQDAVKKLLETGHAYRDYSKAEEYGAERAQAEAEKRDFVYSRTWMAENDADAKRFESEGRTAVIRLKMPREGKCIIDDKVRGRVEFDWAKEQDHVIQRTDGSCLYNLANVVDDELFGITHVIRAVEHLANTPRQIFIIQSLGYRLPVYAHIPFVAEPGSKNKLSKRKIESYLKNPEFRKMYEHGESIAKRMGIPLSPESFNPVLVDFYREVGYLPDAIINYLLLLGWSLDDKTEDFSRTEMIEKFSLERIVSASASFDPAKLMAFQHRYAQRAPLDDRMPDIIRCLQSAGKVSAALSEADRGKIARIAKSAGDRLKVSGDILEFDDFFASADGLIYDEKAVEKRIVSNPDGVALLREYRDALASLTDFSAGAIEKFTTEFLTSKGKKFGDLHLPLRISVTGKGVGFSMFETLEIVGQQATLARIDATLSRCLKG